MKLSEIFNKYNFRNNSQKDIEFNGISFSSNTIKNNDIFVAVNGKITAGINFIDHAIKNGANIIICDEKSNIPDDKKKLCREKDIPIITVKNPEIEASRISKLLYPSEPKKIYATTGTNGKTTISNFTQQLLNLIGVNDTATLGTMGFNTSNNKFSNLSNNVNSIIGVNPITTQDTITNHKILNMVANAGINHLILEASSDGLVRHRLDYINFTACSISNLSEDHLITHGTMQEYFMAKMQLFHKLSKDGFAIINMDDKYSNKFYDYVSNLAKLKSLNIIEYGKNIKNINQGIKIENYNYIDGKYDIELSVFGKRYQTQLNLIGEFQIYNALNALAFVLSNDIKTENKNIIDQLKFLKNVNGRMEFVATTKKGAHVYVDYAHNTEALKNALTQLKKITKNRLISVSGISSGKAIERNNTAKIAGEIADIVIFTYLSPRSEDVDTIIEKQQKIYPQGLHGGQTRYDAIKKAIYLAEDGDIILINGQGHEKFIIEYGKPCPFYDNDAIIKIISEQ